MLRRANALADACSRHQVALPAAAMAFTLAHPAVATLCLGVRSAAEVEHNLAHLGATIPEELWAELVDLGLLRADAVTGLARRRTAERPRDWSTSRVEGGWLG